MKSDNKIFGELHNCTWIPLIDLLIQLFRPDPDSNYMFKVNNRTLEPGVKPPRYSILRHLQYFVKLYKCY